MYSLREGEVMPRCRNEHEMRQMLHEANRLLLEWERWLKDPDCKRDKKAFTEAVRNYNALRGVIRTLQWSLKFPNVDDPLW